MFCPCMSGAIVRVLVVVVCGATIATAVSAQTLLNSGVWLHPDGRYHLYEVWGNPDKTWQQAKDFAESQTRSGYGSGYLATITSQAENAFVWDLWDHLVQDVSSVWLGGYQPLGSQEPAGGWTWVTGEAWSYTNWAPGEPNNLGGAEHWLEMWRQHGGGTWNDALANLHFDFVVEYTGLQVIPEPTTLLLFASGLASLLTLRRRAS